MPSAKRLSRIEVETKMSFVQDMHRRYHEAWMSMLDQPFLTEVARGTISDENFSQWLQQDYIFVREAIPSLGLKLARAPLAHREGLSNAITALQKELVLFEAMASDHGIELGGVEPLPTNLGYINFIRVTNTLEPYELSYTVTYTAEKAYLDSWLSVNRDQRSPSKWQRFIDNWTSGGFEDWVASLAENLDELAEAASPSLRARMERKFFETIRYERLFWKMAFYGESW